MRLSSPSNGGVLAAIRRQPPIVWTAVLMFALGGLACLFAVLEPFSAHAPLRLDASIGIVCCLSAIALFRWGMKLPLAVFEILIGVGVLMDSAIVAHSTTRGGMMMSAFAYTWIAVYAASFFPRKAVVAEVGLILASFGVALRIDGLTDVLLPWVVVSGTVCATSFVLVHLNESLRHQASTDQLTGLPNRSGFLAAAERERALAQRSGTPLSVAVIDLDGFKQVNDRLGHAAGDRLLSSLATEWRRRLRAGDVLARHGGDEFVLLMPGTSRGQADEVLLRLRVPELPIRWSAGVSEWQTAEPLAACLARADSDLYELKDRLVGLRESDLDHPVLARLT